MPSNTAAALSYVLGLITGIAFLILEKNDKVVRFHASQSIAFSVVSIIGWAILSIIPVIGWLLLPLWGLGSFVLWLVLILKAYQGEKFSLPYLGEWAEKQIK
ncbi:DUF4870 domain-containing protein [Candidatus Shapirobacteria bacterium]|nr:DUF4870 domain-containing protein [Candidatus Shapirobacteria bacterium]